MSTKTASKKWEGRGGHNPVRNPGPPDRKAHAKLGARIGDYSRMMEAKNTQSLHSRKETGGFHKPGSMQR